MGHRGARLRAGKSAGKGAVVLALALCALARDQCNTALGSLGEFTAALFRTTRCMATTSRRRVLMVDGKPQPIRRLNPPELGAPPGYSQIVDVRAGRIIFIAG